MRKTSTTRPDNRNIVQQIMQEKIVYGGLVLKRGQVARGMLEEGYEWGCIDWFAFGVQAVPDQSVPLSSADFIEQALGRSYL